MPMSWKAPPGWPEPPPGWSPWQGWEPDPDWPKPPEGWVWWKRTGWSRWKRPVIIAAIGLLIVVVGLLFAAEAYDSAHGCGSVDPTDPANFIAGRLVNDTASVVEVGDCVGDFCENS